MYNRLDFIVPWYVDGYADLDREQEAYLDELLAPFLAWHRAQELPLYVQTLQEFEASLDQPVSAASMTALTRRFECAWYRIEDNALDWLLDLGGRLSDEQMDKFMQSLWEEHEEFREEYLERSDKEYYEDTLDSFLDNSRDYLGRLSQEQRAMLEAANARLVRSDAAFAGDRAAWLRQLEGLLQREPGWQLRVREAVEARRGNAPAEYQKVYDHNLAVIQQAIVELLNSRSEKQDRHLRRKLADLREDLEKLVAQGEKDKGPPAAERQADSVQQ